LNDGTSQLSNENHAEPAEDQFRMKKSFRYIPVAKCDAPRNPIILDERIAGWTFWSMITIVAAMIMVATYWLLAHPVI